MSVPASPPRSAVPDAADAPAGAVIAVTPRRWMRRRGRTADARSPSHDFALLRRRHRAGLCVLGVATALLAVADIRMHPGDPLLWLVRIASPLSLVVAYGVLGLARTRAAVAAQIVAEMGVVIALGAFGSYLTGDLTPARLATNPGRLLTVVLVFVCAMTLPWGARAQASLALLCWLIDVATSRMVLGTFGGIASTSGVAMAVALLASVYVAYQLDVHRRRRDAAEAELRRAKEAAEAANRAKGQFLANVSHEIRTPINVVVGTIDMVLEDDVSPEQRRQLDRARAAAVSLLAIINDILDSAKIEAGKMTLEIVDMDLPRTIEGALGLLAAVAEQKGLALTAAMAPSLPRRVRGDPVRLRQILVNLVGNAVKFTAAGSVVLEVRPPADVARGSSGLFQFSVRDSGVGIAPEQLRSIFEPFEQGGSGTARRYGGTGLGLSISANLVALMGGRIWAESEPGRGTTFHFTARFEVPAAPAEARPAPMPVAATG
jgi:signal transduction histidine kinase